MSKKTSRSHHEGVKKQENWPNFFLMEPKEDLFIKNEQQKVKIFYESKLSIYLELLWNLHIEEEGYCNPTYIYIYIIYHIFSLDTVLTNKLYKFIALIIHSVLEIF